MIKVCTYSAEKNDLCDKAELREPIVTVPSHVAPFSLGRNGYMHACMHAEYGILARCLHTHRAKCDNKLTWTSHQPSTTLLQSHLRMHCIQTYIDLWAASAA